MSEMAVAKRTEMYPALREGTPDVMKANLGGSDFTAFDLERVKIPAGGGTSFTIPGLAGDETAATLQGIIVLYQDARAYWKDANPSDQPPDCASEDGRKGVGDPGGACGECPYAEFGSRSDKKPGQACKQVRRLFLLRPKSYLPVLLSLPPTSIRPSKQYLTRVTNAGLPYWGLVTEIGLEKDKSKDGIAYSKATFKAGQVDGKLATLSDEETARVKEYAAAFKEVLKSRLFVPDEFVINGDAK